jgi:sulfur carrier protein
MHIMTIRLNGKDHPLDTSLSVQELLVSIGLGQKPLVVELNKKALFPREYEQSVLADGDQVEVITIAAGG